VITPIARIRTQSSSGVLCLAAMLWLGQATGLRARERNHIHIAVGEPGAGTVISGARASSDVLIYIDVEAAMAAGVKFYMSTNRVILTRGEGDTGVLSPKFFARVVRRVPGGALLPITTSDAPVAGAGAGAGAACS
jgi:hypothetical protein